MFLINFRLKHPDNIIPFGEEARQLLHWFGLTDSWHWLEVGDARLYQYTSEMATGTEYVDYYLSRFIEDFTALFDRISESIPESIYDAVKGSNELSGFSTASNKYLDKILDDDTIDVDAYYDNYYPLVEWLHDRTLSAGHLKGGPLTWFLRNRDRITIVWQADHQNEAGIPYWTAQNGQLEMSYPDFIAAVERFGNTFFSAMGQQVEIAVNKDWGKIVLGKTRLQEEHQERKVEFNQQLELLKNDKSTSTNWELVSGLIDKIKNP